MVAKGEHYDWNLDLSKLKESGKGKFIREEIIQKLSPYPYLQDIVRIVYNSNLRNAIGHSQYHIVPGGICLDNYNRNKYATLQYFSFEDWEKIVVYGWLFRLLFNTLLETALYVYLPLSKLSPSKGIPIFIPLKDGKWEKTHIYSDSTGRCWRFTKVIE